MRKAILLAAFFVVSALGAQATRNLGQFSSLKVYDRIQVELIPSHDPKVVIVSHNQKNVEALNKNGELKLRMITSKLMQGETTKVKVYYQELDDVQASQGAVIRNTEPLESEVLNLTSNEGSRLQLKIEVRQLKVKGNSGGEIRLSGNAEEEDIVINSGARFLGKNLKSGNVSVTTNAGGYAEVFSDEIINATTRAGGTIKVSGNPVHKNEQKVLGGKIIFE